MIVRVQGSGQFRLATAEVSVLQGLDHQLVDAVHQHDDRTVHRILGEMVSLVKQQGSALDSDELVESDTVLPHDDISVEDVQALLRHESLIGTAN